MLREKVGNGSVSTGKNAHMFKFFKLVPKGISNRGESIADHMYRMSLIAMVAPPSLAKRLDLQKCVKMCLIHDMAESVVGDLTPADQVPKIEKLRRETATMDYISNQVLGNVYGNSSTGEEIRAIWQEHEDSETLESHFVQDIDKVELLLQMVEYEKRGNGHINLSEFTYVATKLRLPEMKSWAQEILEDRTEFWNQYQSPSKEEKTLLDQTRKLQDQYYDG